MSLLGEKLLEIRAQRVHPIKNGGGLMLQCWPCENYSIFFLVMSFIIKTLKIHTGCKKQLFSG